MPKQKVTKTKYIPAMTPKANITRARELRRATTLPERTLRTRFALAGKESGWTIPMVRRIEPPVSAKHVRRVAPSAVGFSLRNPELALHLRCYQSPLFSLRPCGK